GRFGTTLRGWHDAVVLQDRLTRVPSDVVAEAPEPAADARVTPRRVLVRHANDECNDIRLGRRPTGAARLPAIVLLRHQRAVQTQNGIGCHDAGNGCEMTTAKHLAFHGEPPAVIVGEAQSSPGVGGAE